MSGGGDNSAEALRLDEVCRAKARAEIAEAEKAARAVDGVKGQGDVLADVLLVKGRPGAGDVRAKKSLSGDDGVAIGKALDALLLPKERYAFCTAASGARDAQLRRVRLLVEAVDPRVVVLLDQVAARDVADAFGASLPEAGAIVTIMGRQVLALDDFEASLSDEAAKRRVWRQLQALSPKTP